MLSFSLFPPQWENLLPSQLNTLSAVDGSVYMCVCVCLCEAMLTRQNQRKGPTPGGTGPKTRGVSFSSVVGPNGTAPCVTHAPRVRVQTVVFFSSFFSCSSCWCCRSDIILVWFRFAIPGMCGSANDCFIIPGFIFTKSYEPAELLNRVCLCECVCLCV